MATAIQRRRGTTSQHSSFTGLAGEITIDTDKNTVVVHDGSTAGGFPLAKYTDVSALGGADITAVVAGAGLTGGSTSGDATINVVGGTGITVNANDIELDNSVVRGLFSASGDLTYNSGTGAFSFTNDAGDIESVVAGSGLTGGGTSGDVTLNVIGGDGITANANDMAVDSTVVRTTGTQTIAGAKTFSNDAIFSGNLTVSGTQTTINTETLTVDDNIIVLNNNESGTPSQDAGIEVERGTSTNVKLQFDEGDDKWQFTNDGSAYNDLLTVTQVEALFSVTDAGGDGSMSYNNTSGVFTYTGPSAAEARAHISASGDLAYNSSTGVVSFTERTDAEVRGLISAGGDLAYNSSTGVISFTNDAGDIEGVTAGSGLTGGGTSGTVSLAIDYENLTGNLIPSANNTYSLGSTTSVWKDVFVGPGSLYVNGQQVLSDSSGTIQVSADVNQNLSLLTSGTGDIELTSGGDIQLKTDVVLTADKTITSSGGVKFASNINMDSNNINNLDDPVAAQDAATKAYVDATAQTGEEVQDIVGAMFTSNTESGITVAYDDTDGTVDFTVGTLNQNTTGSAASLTTPRNISGVAFDGTANIELNTSHIDEDASNKYYTDERVADKIGAILSGTGNISVVYDDSADTIVISETLTTDDITEGDNQYHTTARVRTAVDHTTGSAGYNSSTGVITIPATTDHVTEGTNLFYTTERVQDVVGAFTNGGDGMTSTYDDGAGTLTVAVDGTVARLNAAATFASDVVVSGNFTVNGTTTTVNTATLAVADNVVVLNSGTTGTPSEDSGIEVERGDLTNVKIQWDESSDKWQFTNDGSAYQDILTEAQVEGFFSASDAGGLGSFTYSSGVYTYTGPSNADITGLISVTDAGGDGSLAYSNGVITYTGPSASEVRAHLSAGTGLDYASGVFSVEAGSIGATELTASGVTAGTYGSGTAVPSIVVDADGRITSASTTAVAISHLDTDDLAEGTNKFFSTAQVDAHLTGGTGITYSAGTISLTDTGLITGVTAGTGLSGGATSGTATLNVTGLTTAELAAGSLQLSSESFADSDSVLMTAKAIADKIEAYGYSTTVGDITAVTASTHLTGGGSSGDVSLAVTTGAVANGGSAIPTGNDVYDHVTSRISGLTGNVGDITSVTAGTGISGGGTSGAITVAFDGNELSTSTTDGDGDYFVVVDTSGNSRKLTKGSINISSFSNNAGFTTNVGDITGVTAGSYLTGGGSSGAITLNVDATSANTASKVVARDGSGNFSAGTITATATQAQYADLAERYEADADLEPGTVVMFGGDKEIKACDTDGCHAVAGVISTDPAYLMNSEAEGLPVALTGRVPTKVTGPVAKGDLMVSSGMSGHAKADNNAQAGRIIGKAIGSSEGGEAVIEVLVNLM